jgi:DNA-binding LacI/PurR family transcriptional regulator
MAVGALSALRDLGVRVPDDCAVVGCDDIPFSAHTHPSLTTIHLPFHEIGAAAVNLLLDLIAQQVTEPQQILLPTHLIPRNSSRAIV